MATLESDEAFARRLQEQESGHGAIDPQTPLMAGYANSRNQTAPRPPNATAVNARINEITGTRTTLFAILFMNIPQIIASVIVLSLHWNDPDVCDHGHTRRWKLWALVAALRMLAYSAVNVFMHVFRPFLQERQEYLAKAVNVRNTIDAIGLVWFVVGNMWLFGDDGNGSCSRPQDSPVYKLCFTLLIINYIQICMPCIIAIMLIPIFCFCMPCIIRILARLHDPRAITQGASPAAINSIPTVVIGGDTSSIGNDATERTCPICLNEFVAGEVARALNCKHIFHKECVDEWLRVNASCPTCRKRISDDGPPTTASSAIAMSSLDSSSSSSSSSSSTNNNANNITNNSSSGSGGSNSSNNIINSTNSNQPADSESSNRAVGNLVLHV